MKRTKKEGKKLYDTISKFMDLLPEKHLWKIKVMKEKTNKKQGEMSIVHKKYLEEVCFEVYKDFWDLSEEEKLNVIGHEIGHIMTADLNDLAEKRYASEDEIYACSERTVTRIGMTIISALKNKT
jgi:hypothetical protein